MPLYKKIKNIKIKPKLSFNEFNAYWKWVTADTVFKSVSNKNHNSELPVLAVTQDLGAIPRDLIDFNISVTNQSIASYKIVEEGDFIISLRSFQGGIEFSEYNGICSPAYIVLKPKGKIIETFFKYYLKTDNYIKNLNQNLEGIRDGKMISYKYFSEVGLIFPSLTEQQKIANFIASIDKCIQILEEKKSCLEQYKKGVMQKVFKGELKFKDDYGNDFPKWVERKISSVLSERNIKTPKSKVYPLMAFVANKGVTHKGERYNREFLVSKGKVKKYKQTEYGDFIYSSNNLESGSIGLNLYGSACISPVYSIFQIKKSSDYRFMDSYLKRKSFINKMVRFRQGVVYGQWKIHESAFLKIEEKFPCLEEQIKIANFLSALDKNITLVSTKIEHTKAYKKGLLQQLFV